MRTKLTKLFSALCVIGLLALAAPPARAQVTPQTLTSALTNSLSILGSLGTSTNLSALGRPIEVYKGKGIGLQMSVTSIAGTTTGVFGFWISPSIDGTNYVSTLNGMLYTSVPAGGTTNMNWFTNFPATLVDHARYLKLYYSTNGNGTNNATIQGTWARY